jgi:hypothetical protein
MSALHPPQTALITEKGERDVLFKPVDLELLQSVLAEHFIHSTSGAQVTQSFYKRSRLFPASTGQLLPYLLFSYYYFISCYNILRNCMLFWICMCETAHNPTVSVLTLRAPRPK